MVRWRGEEVESGDGRLFHTRYIPRGSDLFRGIALAPAARMGPGEPREGIADGRRLRNRRRARRAIGYAHADSRTVKDGDGNAREHRIRARGRSPSVVSVPSESTGLRRAGRNHRPLRGEQVHVPEREPRPRRKPKSPPNGDPARAGRADNRGAYRRGGRAAEPDQAHGQPRAGIDCRTMANGTLNSRSAHRSADRARRSCGP